MSTALNRVDTGHIRRRQKPRLFGSVRIESPFPSSSYYSVWSWAEPVWDMMADDLTPKDPAAFMAWQEHIDSQENVLTWGVWRGQELGGFIRFMLNPISPWAGEGHCLFKRDFWGQETTAVSVVLVCQELFRRGLQKINMPTFHRNGAVGGLLKFIGAQLEGNIRRVYMQHGKLIDTKIWGITPEDLETSLRENQTLRELLEKNAG